MKKLEPLTYTPGFEEEIYKYWLDKKFFARKIDGRDPFVIVIPPPNITGSLHMGHALNNVLQDILIRYNLLNGKNSRWIPGTDHGGIATQTVVEKQLLKQGKTKKELGREKFLEFLEDWKKQYGGRILEQLKVLGCACDWDALRFTMDDVCSKAVKTAFVKLFKEGKIYRGVRLINYCVRCETSLSDIEVEYKEEKGKLYYVKYPFADNPDDGIVVATTRPETMLGDTAVAVNPKDERYKNLEGKLLILPLTDKKIPIVYDEIVEMEFGTGAVKVTPGSDFNDWEIGKRHKLPALKIIDEKGFFTKEAGEEFAGLTRKEARKKVLKLLEEQNFLIKAEDLAHSVSVCYRCGSPIEPILSKQWFLEMKELARPALEAAKKGEIKFFPERWKKNFCDFLENIQDWCISRQIWWGHRLPVYYCKECIQEDDWRKGIIVSEEKPEKCPVCGSKEIFQDEDVLDTWFSSGLWPFEVFGWPEKTEELNYFFPTSVLVTGHEILYLWVARMVMMSLKFTGKIPFHHVFIHGIVRDKTGKKMSKSLGNTIDPLEIIKDYGVDALRFAISKQAVPGHDLLISNENFISARNFMNKIWNSANVILRYGKNGTFKEPQTIYDRWFLTEFSRFLEEIKHALESYDVSKYSRAIYDFYWGKFCDWWLEILKLRDDDYGKDLSGFIFRILLAVAHPVIPFITEKLYQIVRENSEPESILNLKFPKVSFTDEKAREDFDEVIRLITGIRNLRATLEVPHSSKLKIAVSCDENLKEVFKKCLFLIKPLAKVSDIEFSEKQFPHTASFASAKFKCQVLVEGVVDLKRISEKIKEEVEKLDALIKKTGSLLENENFRKKAKPEVCEEKKKLFERYTSKKENLKAILDSLAE